MGINPSNKELMKDLHRALEEAVRDLKPDQWYDRPNETTNHVAFALWHFTRTEDNLVRFVFQRKPTVWMEGGWDRHFGLDSKAQGTGMPAEEAANIRLNPVSDFLGYMRIVHRNVEEYLENVTDAELAERVLVKPLGEDSRERHIGRTILTHGYSHLGELWVLRGLMGLRGTPL